VPRLEGPRVAVGVEGPGEQHRCWTASRKRSRVLSREWTAHRTTTSRGDGVLAVLTTCVPFGPKMPRPRGVRAEPRFHAHRTTTGDEIGWSSSCTHHVSASGVAAHRTTTSWEGSRRGAGPDPVGHRSPRVSPEGRALGTTAVGRVRSGIRLHTSELSISPGSRAARMLERISSGGVYL